MDIERLTYMANQIARNLAPQGEIATELTYQHLKDFWDPRMRRQLFELLDAGGAGFRPLVLDAAGAIRRPAAEQAA